MSTVRSISEKKLETNRRNARQSTGPKTDAGKHASRMNAVTHGLLAKAVVITAGDYREDAEEFAQLLDDLREQFTPVGVAEDLEVQEIGLYYWRKMRAIRYEHGATRMRTGDLRQREKFRREGRFDMDMRLGCNLEQSSGGIQYLIDYLEYVKQEVRNGTVSGESYKWLEQQFPDEFAPPDETQLANEILLDEETAASPAASKDCGRQMVAKIDEHLRRLSSLQEEIAESEALNLESKISAAALPGSAVVDKLIRYETSNDRALDRALKRLEVMQARRRKQGDAPPEK